MERSVGNQLLVMGVCWAMNNLWYGAKHFQLPHTSNLVSADTEAHLPVIKTSNYKPMLWCCFSSPLQVDNFIPSVSAVTGVQPQCYVWRICIALHCTPRFAVAVMYYNMYKRNVHYISEKNQPLYLKLMRLNFWLNVVENSCLVAVTYISNRDNYRKYKTTITF